MKSKSFSGKLIIYSCTLVLLPFLVVGIVTICTVPFGEDARKSHRIYLEFNEALKTNIPANTLLELHCKPVRILTYKYTKLFVIADLTEDEKSAINRVAFTIETNNHTKIDVIYSK